METVPDTFAQLVVTHYKVPQYYFFHLYNTLITHVRLLAETCRNTHLKPREPALLFGLDLTRLDFLIVLCLTDMEANGSEQ